MVMVKNRVEKQASVNKTNRFMELEGLRVVAACIVVVFHSLLMFYPGYFYGVGSAFAPVQNMRFEDNLFQNPFNALLSGTFAVGVFFVLSGFVLSVGYFQKKESSILVKMASKRYLRLMLPALVSILIAWAAISLGLARNMSGVVAVVHSGWLAPLWQIHPDFFSATWQGLIGIFTSGQASYNPVLWTIQLELIGSFLVFGVCFLFAASRYRWMVYLALIIAFMNVWLFGFITGMILADLYVNKKSFFEKLNHPATYLLLLGGVILGSYPSSANITSPLYRFITIPGFTLGQCIAFYITLGATMIVVAILSVSRLSTLFSHRLVSGLGKYTYSLYLMHLPVLLTVCSSVFLIALPIGVHKASLAAILCSWAVLIPIAVLFERCVDKPAINFASYCAEIYLGKREFDWRKKYTQLRLYIAIRSSLLKRREVSEAMPEIEAE